MQFRLHPHARYISSVAAPLAFFLTWTTYGTWLHGDERESVDRNHNVPQTPRLDTNLRLEASESTTLKHPPFRLDSRSRAIVEQTIVDHCKFRTWDLLAFNVRSNHVHVVVSANEESPEQVASQFKAWATRRLRTAGLVASNARLWTRHCSTRYLNNESGVRAAIRYVTEAQGPDLDA